MSNGFFYKTYTGKMVNPLSPTLDAICIEDIAHHLSRLCRYAGAVPTFYSVAEHCVRVSRLFTPDSYLAKWGLLHDATEAYLQDLPKPVKDLLPGYKIIEDRFLLVISAKFNLPVMSKDVFPDDIEVADTYIREAEMRDMMGVGNGEISYEKIEPWTMDKAEAEFLNRYKELFEIKEDGMVL